MAGLSRPRGRGGPERRAGGWEGTALRALEFVAYPALAGCALLLLCLPVVTWLPALAAAAYALQAWRDGAAARPFLGTLRAFGGYWRALWRHALVSTVAGAVLVGNIAFLAARPGPLPAALLALQVGLVLAFVPYHLAVAVVAGRGPGGDLRRWTREALFLAFGSPGRGLALLGAAIAVPVLTSPSALGPLLLGPTLPLLLGQRLADRLAPAPDEPAPHPDRPAPLRDPAHLTAETRTTCALNDSAPPL
ncbi:hypothetical protein O7622_15520 [Micromonospora sp. WMMD1076]|uniref:hypothetical protein n=1 Tax=Micromonospora sp. WMMD1076 TaxID=3016103 RepID=UPI00249CF405|nr:hypothetical protein [Micromonospora sp. WMMD1076]WFF04497.1 hypothetical protein O7622_15520 [Micromonospora sp. WMMD1076]